MVGNESDAMLEQTQHFGEASLLERSHQESEYVAETSVVCLSIGLVTFELHIAAALRTMVNQFGYTGATALMKRNLLLRKKQKEQDSHASGIPDDGDRGASLQPTPPSGLSCCYCYEKASEHASQFVHSHAFQAIVILAIIVAGVIVGLQTYKRFETDPMLAAIDNVILSVFAVECILKIVAEGEKPWLYFTDPEERAWNIFDFIIVVVCIFLPLIVDLGSGSSFAILRLVRLIRVLKLLEKFEQLQMIIGGLIGGMAAVGYILALILMLIFLYACTGCYMFGENDPFNFGNFPTATITLWKLSTLDWVNAAYTNIHGCKLVLGQEYWGDCSTFHDNPGKIMCVDDRATAELDPHCADVGFIAVNTPSPISAVSFFLSFIMLASWVMLSLFMGAVCAAMTENMTMMLNKKAVEKEAKAKAKALRARAQSDRTTASPLASPLRSIATLQDVRALPHRMQRHDAAGKLSKEGSEWEEEFGPPAGGNLRTSCYNCTCSWCRWFAHKVKKLVRGPTKNKPINYELDFYKYYNTSEQRALRQQRAADKVSGLQV
jgi:voltage-gated sodium channel